jgi:hypothetical protein
MHPPAMHDISYPSEVRVALNDGMTGVEHDDLKISVLPIIAKWIRIEDLQIWIFSGGALLGYELNAFLRHDFSNSHPLRPAPPRRPFLTSATLSNARAGDDDTLLRLIA